MSEQQDAPEEGTPVTDTDATWGTNSQEADSSGTAGEKAVSETQESQAEQTSWLENLPKL